MYARDAVADPTTVLVVNTDPASQGQIAEVLVRAGYCLMQTTSGRDAVRLARQYQPDLVLLDLGLMSPSSLDVLESLKADPRTAAIPVLTLRQSLKLRRPFARRWRRTSSAS